jgi:uncharacterized glyoxalase superfamily protein PhnB
MASHIPDDFNALTPFLHVSDAHGFIDWARDALGAEVRLLQQEEGHVIHAELTVEGCVLELSEANEDWPARPASFHLFVPEPDAAVERALEAGGEVIYEIADQEHGERSGGIKDPFGNNWYIAKVTDRTRRAALES